MSELKRRLLISKWHDDQESGREGKRECDCGVAELTETLEHVKYWLHSGLVMHQIVSDPRRLLRKIEDVL